MLKSYFASTDKGPYFNTNQDAYFINLDHNIFGVIDGFGGTGIGDVVTGRIVAAISSMLNRATHDQDATLKYFYDSRRSVECNFIINELLKLHDSLLQESEKSSIYQRGGANCLFLITKGSRVTVISIGKIYSMLYRNGRIQKIILEDDSPILENDMTSIATIGSWPKSAIGLFSPLNYQIKEINMAAGDQILLGTQGAFNSLDYEGLKPFLEKESAKDAIENLMENANEQGNRDNQTVVLLRF